MLGDVYRPLSLNQAPLMFTARRTAELIKYAANAFLATKITFINEIADLSEKVGADVQEVARGIGLDNRIGSKFLHAGPRLRRLLLSKGHPRAGQDRAGSRRQPAHRRGGARRQRQSASARWRARLPTLAGGSLRGKTVAVLGLTFKPDTDDMREAPSIPLVTGLLDMGARVRAHDPVGMEQARKELPDIEYCDDPYACVKGADAMVVVTEWVQYRTLDWSASSAKWHSRWWSICAISIAPRRWRRSGSPMKASGGRRLIFLPFSHRSRIYPTSTFKKPNSGKPELGWEKVASRSEAG